ncbi:unnamed protein product, partial [Cuscuta europaea]
MRAVKNLLCGSRVLSARQNAVIRMNSISYHCLEEPKLESFSSDWYEKAFSKLSMLSHLLNNVDVINGSNAKENQQLPCFNQAGEREPMTVDSLTKVSEILNISAQQRKVVRATICPQVTQHQIWTGALEVILDKLKSEMEYLDSKFPSKETKMA